MTDRLDQIRAKHQDGALPENGHGDVTWLLAKVDRLRAELSGDWEEAESLDDLLGDDAPRIRRLRSAHEELDTAIRDLMHYPFADEVEDAWPVVGPVVDAQRRIDAIHEETS